MLPHQVCSGSAPASELIGWNVGFSARHLILGCVPVVSSSFLAVTSSGGCLVPRWSRPAHTLPWSVLLCPSLSSGLCSGPRAPAHALSWSLRPSFWAGPSRSSLCAVPPGPCRLSSAPAGSCEMCSRGSAQVLWVECVFCLPSVGRSHCPPLVSTGHTLNTSFLHLEHWVWAGRSASPAEPVCAGASQSCSRVQVAGQIGRWKGFQLTQRAWTSSRPCTVIRNAVHSHQKCCI